MRSNNPTIFFEHRHLLDGAGARRPYPGDDFMLPFGKAKVIRQGSSMTVVSWGAMVERCELAADEIKTDAEIVDLRTISPWDREAVLNSLRKTRRCLIVHEDGQTAGFGAEVSATIAEHALFSLDAPVLRVAVADLPIPYNVELMDAVVPSVSHISLRMKELLEY
jgi:2-oxoisovalerate dehydrogenase E1 component